MESTGLSTDLSSSGASGLDEERLESLRGDMRAESSLDEEFEEELDTPSATEDKSARREVAFTQRSAQKASELEGVSGPPESAAFESLSGRSRETRSPPNCAKQIISIVQRSGRKDAPPRQAAVHYIKHQCPHCQEFLLAPNNAAKIRCCHCDCISDASEEDTLPCRGCGALLVVSSHCDHYQCACGTLIRLKPK